MKFLIDEVPVTNSGSTGRTLRCVKYAAQYLKKYGNTRLSHDYTMLKLRMPISGSYLHFQKKKPLIFRLLLARIHR